MATSLLALTIAAFETGGGAALDALFAVRVPAADADEARRVHARLQFRLAAIPYDERALRLLGRLATPEAIATLRLKLADPRTLVDRARTLGALLDATGDVSCETDLISLLDDDDWRVRDATLACLQWAGVSARGHGALRARLAVEDHVAVQRALVAALAVDPTATAAGRRTDARVAAVAGRLGPQHHDAGAQAAIAGA